MGVLYEGDEAACAVTVFPNLALRQSEFGLAHVSPQEVISDGGWRGRLPQARPNLGSFIKRSSGSRISENENGDWSRDANYAMSVARYDRRLSTSATASL